MSGCTWIEAQRGNREWWGVVQISEWETLSAPTDGCQVGLALLDFSVFPKTQEIWIFMGGTFQYLNIIFFLNMMWADILWAKQNTCMDVRPAKALNQNHLAMESSYKNHSYQFTLHISTSYWVQSIHAAPSLRKVEWSVCNYGFWNHTSFFWIPTVPPLSCVPLGDLPVTSP